MSFNPFSLEGKAILVTGASSGIGRAIALACCRMGAKVYGVGRNPQKLNSLKIDMQDANPECDVFQVDLTDPVDIENLCSAVPELDGIVHCAGIGDRTLLKMVRQKDLDRVMKTNFEAPVLLQRALLKKNESIQGLQLSLLPRGLRLLPP